MIDYNGGAKGYHARYAVPWRRCHYCNVELRFYFKTTLVCDRCDVRRLPDQTRARTIVRGAVRAGRLPNPRTLKCLDCGAPASRYDHRDYGKPLQVDPVCASCNGKRGPADWGSKSGHGASKGI